MQAVVTKYESIVSRTGTFGLYLIAFSAGLSVSGYYGGLLLLVIAFLISPVAWRIVGRDKIFISCVFFTLYVFARTAWAAIETPHLAREHLTWSLYSLNMLLFVCVSGFIVASQLRTSRVMLLALAGLLIGVLTHKNLWVVNQLLEGSLRTGFHLKALSLGLYSAVAILGLLLFAPRLLAGQHPVLRAFLWMVVLSVLAIVFISTQARGAWLAATLVAPLILFLNYRSAIVAIRDWSRRDWAIVSLAVLLLAAILAMGLGMVSKRLLAERPALEQITGSQSTEHAPPTPIGHRLNLYRFGIEKWLERPVFGWGPGATKDLIKNSGRDELLLLTGRGYDWIDHLHSAYLEVLVRFGVTGGLLLTMIFLLLMRGVWAAHRQGDLPRDYMLFITGAFGILMLTALTDFPAMHFHWRAFVILFAAVAHSYSLRAQVVIGRSLPEAERPA